MSALTPLSDALVALEAARRELDDLEAAAEAARARRAAAVAAMRAEGLTVDAVARHAGVTRQTVHRWASGR